MLQHNGQPALGSDVQTLTESDRNVRVQHLEYVQKFKKCYHTKKSFGADHFRQHLRHSHAGMGEKWTDMLQNACFA